MAYLRPLSDGKLDWWGIAGPALIVVARNGNHLVAKQPGYADNRSGIRGMPNRAYNPSRHIAFRIIKEGTDGALEVEKLIEWGASSK